MKTLKYVLKVVAVVLGLTVTPLYAARALDLNTVAFLVVFYFFVLLFWAGACDVKGKNIASFRGEKPDKILFPFPLNGSQSDR